LVKTCWFDIGCGGVADCLFDCSSSSFKLFIDFCKAGGETRAWSLLEEDVDVVRDEGDEVFELSVLEEVAENCNSAKLIGRLVLSVVNIR